MKIAKVVVPGLTLLLLASCGGNAGESSAPAVDSSEPAISSPAESSSEASSSSSRSVVHPSEDYPTPKIEEYEEDISIDWGLYDPDIYYQFCTGYTYPVTYTFPTITKEGVTIYIEDTSICSIEETDSGFNLTAHKAGNTYIRIIDREGKTHYQKILEVRTTVEKEDMAAFLCEVPYYETWPMYTYSDLQLIFLSDTEAMIQGNDEGTEIGTVQFNYELSTKESNLYEYRFDISGWESTATTWNPFCFYVDVNGSGLKIMSGTEDYPVSVPFIKHLNTEN